MRYRMRVQAMSSVVLRYGVSYDIITLSYRHIVISSYCHIVTLSYCHVVTFYDVWRTLNGVHVQCNEPRTGHTIYAALLYVQYSLYITPCTLHNVSYRIYNIRTMYGQCTATMNTTLCTLHRSFSTL